MLSNPVVWGMTAHVLYKAIDPMEPATHSTTIIQHIIRRHIGFTGPLISDCLTMKALTGSFKEKVKKSFQAGCDIVLHCNGNLDEMIDVAVACDVMPQNVWNRVEESLVLKNIMPLTEEIQTLQKRIESAMSWDHATNKAMVV